MKTALVCLIIIVMALAPGVLASLLTTEAGEGANIGAGLVIVLGVFVAPAGVAAYLHRRNRDDDD